MELDQEQINKQEHIYLILPTDLESQVTIEKMSGMLGRSDIQRTKLYKENTLLKKSRITL